MDDDKLSYEKTTHLVAGIYQYSNHIDNHVYITFIDDHDNEFIAKTESLSDVPYEFDVDTTYEIVYSTKSDDSEPVVYTDVIRIKPAEYDLNIIDEDTKP
jgi:hypothetical protein